MSSLTVAGGAASIDARTEDMRTQAAALRTMAEELGGLAATVAAVAVDGRVLASGIFDPVGLARIEAAVGLAHLPPEGVSWLVLEYEATATLLLGAAEAYELTDAALAEMAGALRAVAGEAVVAGLFVTAAGAVVAVGAAGVVGLAGLAALPPGARALLLAGAAPWLAQLEASGATDRFGRGLTAAGMQTLFDNPWLVESVAAGLPGTVSSPGNLFGLRALTHEQVVALVLAGGGLAGAFHDGPVRVTRTGRADGAGPVGVGDVFTRMGTMTGAEETHQVRVTRVTGADGEVRFVVEIPGTEQWDPTSTTNPADTKTNLEAVAGIDSNMEEAVRLALTDAMREAGIPDGEHGRPEVLLAGHSQGGIVAARLAQESAFNVTDVLTGGSPVSRIDLPADVHLLSLEHDQDVVPRLDGEPNPSARNVTTISRDVAALVPGDPALGGAQNVGDAHASNLYGDTGALVDTSTDPAVVAARERLDRFLTGGATTSTYEATQEATP